MASSKKVVVCVDWIEIFGGAEKVLKGIVGTYPNCEIWTLWCNNRDYFKKQGVSVHESFLSKLPNIFRRPLSIIYAPFYWRNLPYIESAFILISSHQFAHLAKFKGSSAPVLAYIHTPARYIWFSNGDRRMHWFRFLLKPLQFIDKFFNTAQFLAVNSSTVQKRVASKWNLPSTVIYPPVKIDSTLSLELTSIQKIPYDDYLVCAGRWIPYKRFDLAIEVAIKSKMNLVIVGGGPEEKKLRQLAKRTDIGVYFINNPPDSEYLTIVSKAKALLFPGIEDFGIVPVEAMLLGIPVIGINQGGLVESVRNNVSGFLCSDVNEMVEAVGKIHSLDVDQIRSQGAQFSYARFSEHLEIWIESKISPR
jgi:glycosyltransferase involved in cell wall biosynthesis